MVLRRTYELTVVPKRTFYNSGPENDLVGRCGESTAAAWARMTAGEAGGGLSALAAGWLD